MKPKHKILIVEDEPFLRDVLNHALTEHGYSIFLAENGRKALATLTSHPVDVILTDILMPEMEGFELLLALRLRYPEIPVFAMSGGSGSLDSDYLLTTSREFGAVQVFEKPVDLAALLRALESTLSRQPEPARRELMRMSLP